MRQQVHSKVLVTGAAGFIGSHVVDELIKRGYDVVAMDDLSGGFLDNISQNAEFVEGSINDVALINRLFSEHQFEYVFHLAAYAAEGLSHFIKRFNYTNNLIGSVNLINASVNAGSVRCFVFASSIAVYGRGQVPMIEDMTPMPEDPYGISKFAVELDLKEAHDIFGLNYVVFRPHNVYGERQNLGDPYRNVIGIFINRVLQNEAMAVFGDGRQTRAFSYITDVAPIIAECVNRPESHNQIFNIGADRPYAVIELAHVVAEIMGVNPNIIHLDPRNEVVHAFSSHEKIKKYFGDLVKDVPLEEGIAHMVAWARSVGVRCGQPFKNIEVHKNMPTSWATLIKEG